MSIDPQVSMAINVLIAIAGALATMSPSMFPSYIPQGTASEIIQTCGFLTTMWGAINAGLHGMSSSQAGPLTGDRK